ncbi:MAG: hypothetical protein ACPGXK_00215 [Phycisphaerae bacterium]
MRITGLEKLNGYKTYIGVILGTLVLMAESLGWITSDLREPLLIAIGGLTGVSIIHKVEKKVPDKPPAKSRTT